MRASAPTITLRPATAEDEDFLRTLHASTRDDLTSLPLAAETRNALLRLQFDAQDQSWRLAHPGADFDVVLVDGDPVGRFLVDRAAAAVHVVDITVSPGQRGRGIASELLGRVTDEADVECRPVLLHVDRGNVVARRLYERLGFSTVDGDDFRVLMRRDPVS